MFDYTKTRAAELTPDELVSIANSPAFADCDGVPDKYGRVKVKNYRGLSTLQLDCHNRRLDIAGALPTVLHGHNTTLLTYSETKQVVEELAEAVGLPAHRLEVVNVELSVDIDLPTSPQPLLQSLQHHKQSPFGLVAPRSGVARALEYLAIHADYRLKFYDKGTHAAQQGHFLPTGVHRLRYEVVCLRGRAVCNMLGLERVTLADLAKPATFAAAAAALLEQWQHTVRDKPLDFTGLKMKDASLLQSGGNPDYWRRLRAAGTPQITIKRHKAHYRKLLEESDKRTRNDLYGQRIPEAVAAALASVHRMENDTILHTFSKAESGPPLENTKEKHPLQFPTMLTLHKEGGGEGESGGMRVSKQAPTRCCHTCGLPINTGNATAKFCSPKERGSTAAKRCRNADSNLRNNKRRALLKVVSEPVLFDQRPFVRVPEHVREFVIAAA